jgi:pectin methylesterase-like acyl-CoA thioesterase
VCIDTPLKLVFDAPPEIGNSGRIIVRSIPDEKVVDTLDFASQNFSNNYAGGNYRYQPIRVNGNHVSIELHAKALSPNHAYQIEVNETCFKDSAGNSMAPLGGEKKWRFTTKNTIRKDGDEFVIAQDGTGDYCSIQGLVESLHDDNQQTLAIRIKPGIYQGIVRISKGRDHYHFKGDDRKQVILTGLDNDKMNGGRVGRALFGSDADDLWLENLTVSNATPYHGSQAEAIRIQGDKCIIKDCDFYSFQDTVLVSGRVYVTNCFIAGDVDFIWGQGTAFFDHCEIKAMHDGYYLQTRNPAGRVGYVFTDCALTSAPETTRCWLARINGSRFPESMAAYIRCRMGSHIPAAGWEITGGSSGNVRFLEYASTDLDGKPLDVSKRHPASKQLSPEEALKYSNPSEVFASRDDWNPRGINLK